MYALRFRLFFFFFLWRCNFRGNFKWQMVGSPAAFFGVARRGGASFPSLFSGVGLGAGLGVLGTITTCL
jgi:hypothetical protein